jgi:Flp pilus assembly protein TadG
MNAHRFLRDTTAAAAAEFALIVPLLLLFLLGVIDAGTYAWRLNEVEKAAQMGVRYAVVTNLVASALATTTYVGTTCNGTALTAGDTICAAALGKVTCGSSGNCVCTTAPCPALTRNAAAFDNIAARVRAIAPWVRPTNIVVEYSGSGLGYAGDPTISIAPIVTVKLTNMNIRPMSGFIFGASIGLPTVVRSLSMEDGRGARSN